MKQLTLKPHHKPVREYYATLRAYAARDIKHEGAVSTPFQALLHACAKQVDATLVPQYAVRTETGTRIVIDGMLLDAYGLPLAACEFKDVDDDLPNDRWDSVGGVCVSVRCVFGVRVGGEPISCEDAQAESVARRSEPR